MKKQFIILLFLISGLVINAQQNSRILPGVNIAEKLQAKYVVPEPPSTGTSAAPQGPATGPINTGQDNKSASSAANIVWQPFCGSMNAYGVLYSNQKALQYNDELHAVSFIHRKSKTYQPNPFPSPDPGATSGAIVAEVSTDWGNTWDSTCLWNNNTYWARYPQGGIYNAPGNTNIANAYAVACGPVTPQAGGWVGNFFASKKLDVFDNVASTVTDAQQYLQSTAPPWPAIGKVDYAYHDFHSTDDGLVRSLGMILTTPDGGGVSEGARVITGTFNSGIFNWTGDSLAAPVNFDPDGNQLVAARPGMAWNESGSTGFVWFYGSRQGSTGANIGIQPIIWKSTDYGQSWSLIPGIDFNDPKFAPVLARLYPTIDSNVRIPFFWYPEGTEGTVALGDKLHLFTTIVSTRSISDVFSANGYSSSVDAESGYAFDHDTLQKPIIYDFFEDGLGWDYLVIDTLTSESPGTTNTQAGYQYNPWDGEPPGTGTKVDSDTRIQLSRTPDGAYIVVAWAESDPGFTSGGRRWNQLPNIKARTLGVADKTLTAKVDLTGYSGANSNVKNKAHMLQISPKCDFVQDGPNLILTVPMKVSNNANTPIKQLDPVTHWYSASPTHGIINGIRESNLSGLQVVLYPNPLDETANLKVDLRSAGKITLEVFDILGQNVKLLDHNGNTGTNTLSFDTGDMPAGVYFVNVRSGDATGTVRMVVK